MKYNYFIACFAAFRRETARTCAKLTKFCSKFGILVLLALMAGCRENPGPSSHRPALPVLPAGWNEILGDAHWRLEWLGEDGSWQEWEGPPGSEPPVISLPEGWSTPVLAWPFWPAWNLAPGLMRPGGALFPWDVSGGDLNLSWAGGVDAFFWKELTRPDRSNPAADGRFPWYFDWPKFRELFTGGNLPEAILQDPWLADWREIGRKTVQSGFDRRRIVARNFTELAIQGLEGLWSGSSPFAPTFAAPDDGHILLNVSDTTDTWVSSIGVLKASTSGWILHPHPAEN